MRSMIWFGRVNIVLTSMIVLCVAVAECGELKEKSADQKETTSAQVSKWIETIPALLKSEKLKEAEEQLKAWEKVAPDHPDLYVWKANLLRTRASAQNQLRVDALPKDHQGPIPEAVGDAYSIRDTKTGELAGAIYERKGPDTDKLTSDALDLLLEAREKHPLRMDIHLGIAACYRNAGDYGKVFEVMRRAVGVAKRHDHKGLLWMGNAPMKDPVELLGQTLHTHYRGYARSESPDDEMAFSMAKFLTESYPNDVRGWNDLAAEYSQRDKPEMVLESLLKAHKIDPKDALVARNVAFIYEQQGKTKEAVKFYKLVISLKPDDEETLEEAKQKVKELDE